MITPAPEERGKFILLRNTDTVVVERYTRAGESLTGEMVIPGQTRITYAASMNSDMTVRELRVARYDLTSADTTARDRATMKFVGDSVIVEPVGVPAIRSAVPRGTLPYINPSPVFMELALRRARTIGGTSVGIPIIAVGSPTAETAMMTITYPSVGLANASIAGVSLDFSLDAQGRLVGGSVASQGVTIERVPN